MSKITIINFREVLSEKELSNSLNHAEWVNLWLAMVSSLRVTSEADAPNTAF